MVPTVSVRTVLDSLVSAFALSFFFGLFVMALLAAAAAERIGMGDAVRVGRGLGVGVTARGGDLGGWGGGVRLGDLISPD